MFLPPFVIGGWICVILIITKVYWVLLAIFITQQCFLLTWWGLRRLQGSCSPHLLYYELETLYYVISFSYNACLFKIGELCFVLMLFLYGSSLFKFLKENIEKFKWKHTWLFKSGLNNFHIKGTFLFYYGFTGYSITGT